MAVAVFDADVLIAYLGHADANHAEAVRRMRMALAPGTRRLLAAVNYAEVLIGPLRHAGPAGAETVDAMLVRLGIETIQIDARSPAGPPQLRVSTGLKLPDAYAVAIAIDAAKSGNDDVRLESFDAKVVDAYAALRPLPPGV